jgi:hypothetical protein
VEGRKVEKLEPGKETHSSAIRPPQGLCEFHSAIIAQFITEKIKADNS